MGWVARAQRALGSRRAIVVTPLVALLLAAPSLTTGWVADDHIQQLMMRPDPGITGLTQRPLDLFVFADGDPDRMRQLMDAGVFPWTTEPHLKLAFFRPLSALTHQLDRLIAPGSSGWAHAHNLVWFGVLLVILGMLYRRVHTTPWVAGLALLMYALDDVHGPTFGWIANRQAIVAACFAFGALLLHRRWRVHGWRPGMWLGPLAYGASLLAGESGLGLLAYVFAYAVCLETGTLRARAASLVAYAVVTVVWLIGYSAGGYGAAHSGAYVDPSAAPLAFLAQAGTYGPVLITSQLAGLWSDVFPVFPDDVARYYWIGCLVYLVLFLDVIKVTLAASAAARFWALGMVLSVIPICSTVPADRLLIFVGVGAMGLIAAFLAAPEGQPGVRPSSRLRRFSVKAWTIGLVLTHLVAGPLLLPIRARTMATVGSSLQRAYASMPATPDVVDKTVIAVNPPSDPYMAYMPLMRASRGEPVPGRLRWLAVGQSEVVVTREDARTLLVRPAKGYLDFPSEQLVRHPDRPLAQGQVVTLAGVTVEVVALTSDGRPAATRWRFERELEDSAYIWLRWGDDHLRFAPFVPPAVGATTTLPAVDTMRAFLGD